MTTSISGLHQQEYIRRNNPYGYASSADVQQALSGASAFQGYASSVPTAQVDTYTSSAQSQVSQTDNGCSDGKDDGHISFWSKIGHAVKGVGKTIVNGVKGMFTDSKGNFSLGKTLLSVGVIAASVAFPAVGLALCVAGGISGAVQVGKGIKNACAATTDAQAKEAWENIGGGTFQVAASVAGAKASFNAMKATSTATNGLSSLSEGASFVDKVKAFSADATSSTVNRFNTLSGQASTLLRRAEITDTFNKQTVELQASELADVRSKVEGLEAAGKTATPEYQSALNELHAREAFSGQGLKTKYYFAKNEASAMLSNALDKIKNVNFRNNFNVSALSQKAQNAYTVLTTKGYSQAVTECGYETVAQLISVIASVDMETVN